MEGDLHTVFNGNADGGIHSVAVNLNIGNIPFGTVNKADLFSDPFDMILRNLFFVRGDGNFVEMAVFTGEADIIRPQGTAINRDSRTSRENSMKDLSFTLISVSNM